MENFYKIAGLTVKMSATGRTAAQAEAYRCQPCPNPDMDIDNDFQRYHKLYPHLSEDDAQYTYTGACFYTRLLQFQGMMLHSSAVVVDGRAYLFSANSGTGKSTHTQLWLKQFGDRAYILNDDKPALRLIDGVWYACGTPWSGKYDISVPACVPLAGIAILDRGEENRIERYSGSKALFALLEQMLRPQDQRMKLLELMDRLVSQVPVWKLYCNMDPEAALVSFNAMSGAEKE